MSKRVSKFFSKPSRTQQSFKAECDINLIMKRFKKHMNSDYLSRYNAVVGGQFGDFSDISDYRSAIEQVETAKQSFMQLPAVVRKRFDNDPAMFLDFVGNPSNHDEMVSLGLIDKPQVQAEVSKPE